MASPIVLPRQGQSVESCIITNIHVRIGDKVEKGQLLFSYETDKASFELEAEETGTILAIFHDEGDEVPVLSNIGVIGNKGEPFDEFEPGNTDKEEPVDHKSTTPETLPTKTTDSHPPTISNKQNGFISPRAKKLAVEYGIDTLDVQGSGPGGRIIERDIQHFISQNPKRTALAKKKMKQEGLLAGKTGSGPAGAILGKDLISEPHGNDHELVPLTNIRKLIAKSMHQSLQNSAQLTHHLGADARNILSIRKKVKEVQKQGYRHNLTLNDLICYAVVKTLADFPRCNAHFLGDAMKIFNKVHLGLAVDTERGLMVPVIKNADSLKIEELSYWIKQRADECRKGNIDPDLLAPEEATFTISNLGNYGVEMFTPVINLPQVAILGVNTITPRPKDLGNGAYGFVPYLGLSLTYDHQALDGGEATRFLKSIATKIEELEINL